MWATMSVVAGVLVLPATALASSAVVLVSGFDTTTPFSVPAASCATKAGPTWSAPTGPAASLRAAGEAVFTAPIANSGGSPGPPCTEPGGAVPPAADVLNSNGDVNDNGAALKRFLQFLATKYGVTSVSLIGHSDGGLWSRSAITQLRAANVGPVVQSLTTLGTPHTGSFGADLAEYVVDGRCEASNPTVQAVCEALLSVTKRLIAALGPIATRELSSSFLAGWNPEQTIGCPVSVAAGTYVKVPYIGWLLPKYYNPNDGIVGEASALGQASTSLEGTPIPGPGIAHVISIGAFPVIHSSSLSFLGTTDALTNDAAVGAAVLKAVQRGLTGTPCAAPVTGLTSRPTHLVTVRVQQPFAALAVNGRPGRVRGVRQVALLLRGASLSCRGRTVRAVPLLGSKQVRFAALRCAGTVRTRGRVLFLRQDPRQRTLVVTRRSRSLTARLRGPALRHLRLSVRVQARWRLLRDGRARLPVRAGAVSIRAVGVDRTGQRWLATAVVGP